MKCMRKRRCRGHTIRMRLELVRKLDWREDLSKGEKIGSREREISVERYDRK